MDPEKDKITLELYRFRYEPYKAELPGTCPNCGADLRAEGLVIVELRLGDLRVRVVDAGLAHDAGDALPTDDPGWDTGVRCGACDHVLVVADVKPVDVPSPAPPRPDPNDPIVAIIAWARHLDELRRALGRHGIALSTTDTPQRRQALVDGIWGLQEIAVREAQSLVRFGELAADEDGAE